MKKITFTLIIFACFILFATTTNAAWKVGTIDTITVTSAGVVDVVVNTGSSTVWARLTGTEWKTMLATALTAKAGDLQVQMNYVSGTWTAVKLDVAP